MKSHSQSRHSHRRQALPPSSPESSPAAANRALSFFHPPSPATHGYPNQSLAKHNRKPSQLAENKQRDLKSIASFCRLFLACHTPPTRRCFLVLTARQSPLTPQFLFSPRAFAAIIVPFASCELSPFAPAGLRKP